MASAPPVLKKKLKRVSELRTDTPAMLDALESLSAFYGDNTVEARRNLRGDIEARGLALVDDFVRAFEPLHEHISSLDAGVQSVVQSCDEILAQLDLAAGESVKFAEAQSALNTRRAAVSERAKLMDAFLRRFKLSDRQLAALSQGPGEGDGGEFFDALDDVVRIRAECQALIASQFQSAGLELLDAMGLFQEQAHERLFAWVRRQCEEGLDADFPEPSDTLLRGVQTLAAGAPAYLESARESLADARAASLARRFAHALSQGGLGGRPIEMHSHDPVRYVGDMLAWLHQAMAVERALVLRLFGAHAAAAEAAEAREEQPQHPPQQYATAELLDRVFQGVAAPLDARARTVLGGPLSLVVAVKLGNLLDFYTATMAGVMGGPETRAVAAVAALRDEAQAIFFAAVKQQCDKLLASPPAYPRDLSVALEVAELIRRMSEVLAVHNEASAGGGGGGGGGGASASSSVVKRGGGGQGGATSSGAEAQAARAQRFVRLLAAFIEPLLAAVRASAGGLDRADAAVYIVNNLVAIQGALTRYDFAAAWVQQLTGEIGDWMDLLVKEQAAAVLRRCGLAGKMELAARAEPSLPLNKQAGMDPESLRSALDGFYKSLFSLVMPEFDRLASPRLRVSARNSTAQTIALAYDQFYARMQDEKVSGYTKEQLAKFLLHDAAQVRQLLDA